MSETKRTIIEPPPPLPGVDPSEPWPWLPRAVAWLEPDERGDLKALFVACPFCGDVHRHGGAPLAEGETHWGMRLSHCLRGASSYLLVPAPPGEPRPKGLSKRERQAILLADDRQRGISPTGGSIRVLR